MRQNKSLVEYYHRIEWKSIEYLEYTNKFFGYNRKKWVHSFYIKTVTQRIKYVVQIIKIYIKSHDFNH